MNSKSSEKCESCAVEEIISRITESIEKDNNIVIVINCSHAAKPRCHRKSRKSIFPVEVPGNRDDENLKELCALWFEQYGYESVLAGKLRSLAKKNGLFQYMDFSSREHQVVFSKLLINRTGRNYGGFAICADVSAKYNRYYLKTVG